MKTIYLDYAAATSMDERVLKVMQPYFSQKFYNPSATYLSAQSAKKDIEGARKTVAGVLGVRPSEIVFTAGGTEANNLAINGVMRQFSGSNVVVSAIEHESVLEPARQYGYKEVPVTVDGIVDVSSLGKVVDDETVMVSVMYANNEIGTLQPVRQIAQLVEAIRKKRLKQGNTLPLYFHTDACQAANYIDLHANRLGVDMMTLNGGKIYGPKQSGVLYVKTGVQLQPQILGGGQERGMRSGTENVAGIIGFACALDLAQKSKIKESKRLIGLQKLFYELVDKSIPNSVINGSKTSRLPNNVHVTLCGQDNERLMMQLDEQGIQCAVGSACSASNEEPSHVLKAIGLTDEQAQSSLRFSMGKDTAQADIKKTVIVLKQIVT